MRSWLVLCLACSSALADVDYDAFSVKVAEQEPASGVRDLPPTAADVMKDRMLRDYGEASRKAAREGKTLYVWVAYNCPSSAVQLPEAIHCFVDSFQDDATQRVIVATPNGRGWLSLRGTVMAEDCCAATLRRTAEPEISTGTNRTGFPSVGPPAMGWGPSSQGGMMMRGMIRGNHAACST